MSTFSLEDFNRHILLSLLTMHTNTNLPFLALKVTLPLHCPHLLSRPPWHKGSLSKRDTRLYPNKLLAVILWMSPTWIPPLNSIPMGPAVHLIPQFRSLWNITDPTWSKPNSWYYFWKLLSPPTSQIQLRLFSPVHLLRQKKTVESSMTLPLLSHTLHIRKSGWFYFKKQNKTHQNPSTCLLSL